MFSSYTYIKHRYTLMRVYNVSTCASHKCIVKISECVKLYQSVKYDMNTIIF